MLQHAMMRLAVAGAVAVACAALPSCVTKVEMGMMSEEEVARNLAAAEEASMWDVGPKSQLRLKCSG